MATTHEDKDIRKIRLVNIGFKKNYIPWNKGKKLSNSYKEKMKKSRALKKFRHTDESRLKISLSHRGENNWRYIDGKKSNNYGFFWNYIRKKVYERDNYTCQECGVIDVRLEAHHIIPFRIVKCHSLDNLVTLCKKCHMRIENTIIKNNVQIV
jgi:hypothetical protein